MSLWICLNCSYKCLSDQYDNVVASNRAGFTFRLLHVAGLEFFLSGNWLFAFPSLLFGHKYTNTNIIQK